MKNRATADGKPAPAAAGQEGNRPVSILIAEDSEDDLGLILRALRRGGFEPASRRVRSIGEMQAALAEGPWDAVLSDFSMPGFNGLEALATLRATSLDTPFILISGVVGEATAVEAMKAGASDFIMKQSLARLAPALERGLKEFRARVAHRLTQAELVESEERFRGLTALSSDWYWEQDAQFRFVKFSGEGRRAGWAAEQLGAVGLRRWEIPGLIPLSGSWDDHKGQLEAHKSFRDLEYLRTHADGSLQYMAASGEPIFDTGGSFTGYRGVATDITERKRADHELQRFRAAMEVSSDGIALIDRASLRYIDVNKTLCDMVGLTRQEMIGLTPMDFFGIGREILERDYDALIADNASSAARIEAVFRHADGSMMPIESRRHAMHTGDGWVIVVTARDITERKEAERKILRLNRVYAVLSGINSAIVRIRERDELFREVCRIAVADGGFMVARVIAMDENAKARIAANSQPDSRLTTELIDEYNRDPAHARSLVAQALRSGQPIVSNDIANDVRIDGRGALTKDGNYALALLPMVVEGRVAGMIVLRTPDAGIFDDEELRLLKEVTANVSLALHNIEKEETLETLAAARVRDEDVLRRFGAAMDAVADAIYLIDRESMRYEYINDAAFRRTNLTHANAGRPQSATHEAMLVEQVPWQASSRSREELERVYDEVIAGGVTTSSERQRRNKDGSVVWDEFRRHAVLLGGRWMIVVLIRDITERKAADARILRLNRVHAVLSGINTLIVRVSERDELFRKACRIAVGEGGFAKAWIGMVDPASNEFRIVAACGGDPLFFPELELLLREKVATGRGSVAKSIATLMPVVSNEIAKDPEVLLKDHALNGGARSLAVLPLVVAGTAVGVLVLNADVEGFFDAEEMKLLTELAGNIAFAIDHIKKQERIEYLASYDELTGLANRTLFLERTSDYLRRAASGGHNLALFVLDIERFKNINDSLGREAGDSLLKQVANWLVLDNGDANLVARIGADQFATVLPEIGPQNNLRSLDDSINAFLDHPFRLNDEVFRVAGKLGIALFPKDGPDAETLLRNAEAALKKAKAVGERYVFYAAEMNARVAANLTLENQLRQATEKEEFVLHYQPKIDLMTGRITSAEALIRWNDPRTGLVPPGHFIPILEETGLILDVGRWALRKAIEDYLRWRAAGLPAVRIAVNVSPLQLRNRGLVAEIEQVIGIEAGTAAGLELEITESVIMHDIKRNITTLQAIRAMGVTVAIDDFGTGFSSLAYLSKLPVDTLKIDRSFVVDMTNGPQGMALVSTVIKLAHSLELKVVAEGVETEEQSSLLRLLGCDEMQGYLFSKPVPAADFEARFLAPPVVPAQAA